MDPMSKFPRTSQGMLSSIVLAVNYLIFFNQIMLMSKQVFFSLQLPEDIEWHFIGNLQSNKARALLGSYYFCYF